MFKRILTLHDGSSACDAAFDMSMELASHFGGRLLLLAIALKANGTGLSSTHDAEHERLSDLLASLAKVARNAGVDIDGEVAMGEPVAEITKYVKHNTVDHVVLSPDCQATPVFSALAELCNSLMISLTFARSNDDAIADPFAKKENNARPANSAEAVQA
jgi:ribosomal protein L7Ae-like RNA K-turn-binding protein